MIPFIKNNTPLIQTLKDLKEGDSVIVDFNYIRHDGLSQLQVVSKLTNWAKYNGIDLRHEKKQGYITRYRFWIKTDKGD